jgi:hypothetical protein
MGFQVDRATKIDFLVLVKGGRQKGSQVNPIATSISALVKGNRQMGFQVDRATNIDFWFWLKEVARRDLRFPQLQHRFQLWLKGIARWDSRLTKLQT